MKSRIAMSDAAAAEDADGPTEAQQYALPEAQIPFDDFRRISELAVTGRQAGELEFGSQRRYAFVYRNYLGWVDKQPGDWLARPAGERLQPALFDAYAVALLNRLPLASVEDALNVLGAALAWIVPEANGDLVHALIVGARRTAQAATAAGAAPTTSLAPGPLDGFDRIRVSAADTALLATLDQPQPRLRAKERAITLSRHSRGRITYFYHVFLAALDRRAPTIFALPPAERRTPAAVQVLVEVAAPSDRPWEAAPAVRGLKFAFDHLFPVGEHQWMLAVARSLEALDPDKSKRDEDKRMHGRAIAEDDIPLADADAFIASFPETRRGYKRQRLEPLKKSTRKVRWSIFRYFLGAIQRGAPSLLALPFRDKITPEAIDCFITEHELTCEPATVAERLDILIRIIARLEPGLDIDWLIDLAASRPAQRRPRQRDVPTIDAGAVIVRGIKLMRDARRRLECVARTHSQLWNERKIAERYRAGLMLAFWIIDPLRLGNFADLRLGSTFIKDNAGYLAVFDAFKVKNERDHVRRLARFLNRYVGYYLDDVRQLIDPNPVEDAIWASSRGGALSYGGMQKLAGRVIALASGKHKSPQTFRRAAATAAAQHDDRRPGLARSVIGDRSQSVVEQHYLREPSAQMAAAHPSAQSQNAAAIDALIPPPPSMRAATSAPPLVPYDAYRGKPAGVRQRPH
jgi:hypothetical protein